MGFLMFETDLGPQSNPIHPAGIPDSMVDFPTSASSANRFAVTKSTGKCSFTPFFSAFVKRSVTILAPSSSNKELPI